MAHKTILTNNIQNVLRYDNDFVRYHTVIIDIRDIPEHYHQDILSDIELSFYNYGDIMYYNIEGGLIIARYHYYQRKATSDFMVIKARKKDDVLYVTYMPSHKKWIENKTWIVDETLWIVDRSDKEINIIDNLAYYKNVMLQQVTFPFSVKYDSDFYNTRVVPGCMKL